MPEDSKARIDRRLEAEAIASGEILLGPSNREKTVIEAQVQDQLQKEDESRQMIGMVRITYNTWTAHYEMYHLTYWHVKYRNENLSMTTMKNQIRLV